MPPSNRGPVDYPIRSRWPGSLSQPGSFLSVTSVMFYRQSKYSEVALEIMLTLEVMLTLCFSISLWRYANTIATEYALGSFFFFLSCGRRSVSRPSEQCLYLTTNMLWILIRYCYVLFDTGATHVNVNLSFDTHSLIFHFRPLLMDSFVENKLTEWMLLELIISFRFKCF